MNTVDIYAEALRSLCEREGGPDGVAATTGLSAANLKQILAGTLLPSGNPRGVGPSVRKRLSEIYPNWMTPESLESTSSVGGGLSVSSGLVATEASLGQTLARLGQELAKAGPKTRAAVADLLSRYAQDPEQGHALAQAIEMLVRSDPNKKA